MGISFALFKNGGETVDEDLPRSLFLLLLLTIRVHVLGRGRDVGTEALGSWKIGF